jgi:hypothetical protein
VYSLEVGNLYFGGCVPTVWMLALFILVVVFQQFGGWHSILVVVFQQFGGWHSLFWWLCTNILEVGTLYFGGCVPTV